MTRPTAFWLHYLVLRGSQRVRTCIDSQAMVSVRPERHLRPRQTTVRGTQNGHATSLWIQTTTARGIAGFGDATPGVDAGEQHQADQAKKMISAKTAGR